MSDHEPTSSTPTATSANGSAPIRIDRESATHAPREAAELLRSDAGDVSAERVAMDQSGAERITAERVTLTNSGARRIETKSAQLDRSGVVLLKSDNAVIHAGSAVVVHTQQARIVDGRVLVLAGDVTSAEGIVRTLIHIGKRGDQKTVAIGGESALRFGAAGAGFAATLLIGGRLLRRFFGSH